MKWGELSWLYFNVSSLTLPLFLKTLRSTETLIRASVPEWFAEAVTTSWQVASQGKPTITDAITKIGKQEPITFDEFAWEHKAVFG